MTDLVGRLSERKIKRVYCIDDENAAPKIVKSEDVVDAIVELSVDSLTEVLGADDRFTQLIARRVAAEGREKDEMRADLRPTVDDLFNDQKVTASDFYAVAEIRGRDHVGQTASKLIDSFGETETRALSFAGWKSQVAEIVASASSDSRVLLLVDENNDDEGHVDLDGTKLLAELWRDHLSAMAFFDAILITSNCTPEAEIGEAAAVLSAVREKIRNKAAASAVKRAFVLSKQRLTGDVVEKQLTIHIDRITASEIKTELVEIAGELLHSAVRQSIKFLEDIPLVAFRGSVFQSSEAEGSAEIDTLLRLAGIHQRTRLEESLSANHKLSARIVEMRRFSSRPVDIQLNVASQTELRKLRLQEFERPGSQVNPILAPIASGDVFRLKLVSGGQLIEKHAVLLANPCDLMIRTKTGARKLNRGWLVEVSRYTKREIDKLPRNKSSLPLGYVLETGHGKDDPAYLFDNSNIESIDLDILDLCWTNTNGESRLNPVSAKKAYDFVLPSQQKRLEGLAQRAVDRKFGKVELWGGELAAVCKRRTPADIGSLHVSTHVSYSISRMWRLAPEFASAVVTSMSQSIARPAFGHDFLRKVESP
jgi:hypothetical protein